LIEILVMVTLRLSLKPVSIDAILRRLSNAGLPGVCSRAGVAGALMRLVKMGLASRELEAERTRRRGRATDLYVATDFGKELVQPKIFALTAVLQRALEKL
jgi:predicted ArsR family transcriptional regulator